MGFFGDGGGFGAKVHTHKLLLSDSSHSDYLDHDPITGLRVLVAFPSIFRHFLHLSRFPTPSPLYSQSPISFSLSPTSSNTHHPQTPTILKHPPSTDYPPSSNTHHPQTPTILKHPRSTCYLPSSNTHHPKHPPSSNTHHPQTPTILKHPPSSNTHHPQVTHHPQTPTILNTHDPLVTHHPKHPPS